MSEIRKSLSDTQFRILLDAQFKYNNAADSLQKAQKYLENIRSLIYEPLGIPVAASVKIVTETQELVIIESDKELTE